MEPTTGGSRTIDELYDLLRLSVDQSKLENLNHTLLSYAIYARKSTIGDERQEHSIEDQIFYCMEREVKPDKLKVVATIKEKGSAKEPDIRPLFRQLLEDIKSGTIDGIIAYDPDRLSRNMKEAGEIIDLLDKGVIKDLRFATSKFENSPTGKMLLGIKFVLSKQFSEALSETVTRGNVRATEERGVYLGKRVHGYLITKDRQLMPDGSNFVTVQKMFEMRLGSASQTTIAAWANKQGYTVRWKGRPPKPFKWNKATVSDLLREPVYAGVLKYGKSVVKLGDHYEFTPAVSVEDFLTVNKAKDFASAKLKSAYQGVKSGSIRANLLRGMVLCGQCGKPMSSGITSKALSGGVRTEYYYYRCNTEDCANRNKNLRAKVVIGFAIDTLKQYLFTTKENYQRYVADAKDDMQGKRSELNAIIGALAKQSGDKNLEYKRAKEQVLKDPDGLGKHYNLDEIKAELGSLESDLQLAKTKREELKSSVLTYEKYLELFSNIGEVLEVSVTKSVNMAALDAILRKFFSNWTVELSDQPSKQWSIANFNWQEPWNGFVKSGNVVLGRGCRTRTGDLALPKRAR